MQLVRSSQRLPEVFEPPAPIVYPTVVIPQVQTPIAVYEPKIPPAPAPREPQQDSFAKTGVIASLSVLGLLISALIGVGIGRNDRPAPQVTPMPSPSPQIIVVPQPTNGCQILCFGGN